MHSASFFFFFFWGVGGGLSGFGIDFNSRKADFKVATTLLGDLGTTSHPSPHSAPGILGTG